MTRLVEDPVLKQRLAFEPIEDGQAVRVEMWVDPGGGVPPHMHPRMEETFEVLSGELSLLDGRKWSAHKPGEAVVVPAGKRHAYRNNGTVETHAICTARPPQSLEEFLGGRRDGARREADAQRAAEDPQRGGPGRPPRVAPSQDGPDALDLEEPRIVRDHAIHAQRLVGADAVRVVDRPHVHLAARVVHRPHQPRADQDAVRHHRLAAARADASRPARRGGPPPPPAGGCRGWAPPPPPGTRRGGGGPPPGGPAAPASSGRPRTRAPPGPSGCSRAERAAPTSRAAAPAPARRAG